MKVQGLGLLCYFSNKMGINHLILDVK
jgi:hypothetical protein